MAQSCRGIPSRRRRNLKRRLLLAQRGECHYCGRPITYETATFDHLRPKARGGTNAVGNLVLACEPCNRAKGDKVRWRPRPARTARDFPKA